jgi:hypothetical protein
MTIWSYLLSNLAYHDHNVRASLFTWLISHQPAVLFSQNKPAPAISHQPNEQAMGALYVIKQLALMEISFGFLWASGRFLEFIFS